MSEEERTCSEEENTAKGGKRIHVSEEEKVGV